MKILFLSYHFWPPHFGGELRSSIERLQTLSRRGHSVTIFTSGVPGLPNEEENNGIIIKRSPQIYASHWGRGIRRLLFPFWVIFSARHLSFDILHFGSIGGVDPITQCLGMLLVIFMARIKGAKTVYVHSLADTEQDMFSIKGYRNRMRNIWLTQIDAIVSISPALHKRVSKFHQKKSRLLIYGVQDGIFEILSPAERMSFRQEYGIREENCVFAFLGTIGKRKGFDLIVDVFQELSEQFPDWRLWVIGPKSESESQNIIQSKVDELIEPLAELGEIVKYWGKINDRALLARILGASDVFLFPSRKEGFGIAPVEAMACGVPPIIARIPGVTDLVNIEGETGLYCEVGNIDSLKAAMVRLGTDKGLRNQMGAAARQRVVKAFGWDAYIDRWEDLYRKLIKIDGNNDLS